MAFLLRKCYLLIAVFVGLPLIVASDVDTRNVTNVLGIPSCALNCLFPFPPNCNNGSAQCTCPNGTYINGVGHCAFEACDTVGCGQMEAWASLLCYPEFSYYFGVCPSGKTFAPGESTLITVTFANPAGTSAPITNDHGTTTMSTTTSPSSVSLANQSSEPDLSSGSKAGIGVGAGAGAAILFCVAFCFGIRYSKRRTATSTVQARDEVEGMEQVIPPYELAGEEKSTTDPQDTSKSMIVSRCCQKSKSLRQVTGPWIFQRHAVEVHSRRPVPAAQSRAE
ncbi:hypothetical protein EDD37DRAFT_683513 [Exophiala viscosa]|uniref:uncharacterized protein n=1 Tax=Exophiala viscosa TaxID=2486360 RepID=UPI00219F195A|nr:hypothetical protein EDD37DRAFT_683513 [Exophiala viscosa]